MTVFVSVIGMVFVATNLVVAPMYLNQNVTSALGLVVPQDFIPAQYANVKPILVLAGLALLVAVVIRGRLIQPVALKREERLVDVMQFVMIMDRVAWTENVDLKQNQNAMELGLVELIAVRTLAVG